MILAEKENYIRKLNNELNELRGENEKLKDKLILYELENLGQGGFNRSKHGATMFSNNSRTLADTRSNISHTQGMGRTQQMGYHSNFGATG